MKIMNNKKKYKCNNTGITLIALIITIIVLLILAGITIALILGDNGILNKANKASRDTSVSGEAEQVKLAVASAEVNKIDTVDGILTTELINNGLKEQFGEDAEATGNGPWIYEGKENTYYISKDGIIKDINDVDTTPPEVTITLEHSGKFTWTATDDSAIVGYQTNNSSTPPTDGWITDGDLTSGECVCSSRWYSLCLGNR